jgi:hypothetical protein
MSYLGRSLRNRFPLWSEIRRNESSNGSMLLNAIGESLNEERSSFLSSIAATKALKGNPAKEFGHFYSFIHPNIHEYLNYVRETALFDSLEASGVLGNETISLTPKHTYDEISTSIPTRYEVEFEKQANCSLLSIVENESELEVDADHFNFTKQVDIVENSYTCEEIFDFKNEYKKIYIEVSDTKVFDSKIINENFNDHYSVVLRGYDEADRKIEETIRIKDDGIYESQNWFKKLCPLKKENSIVGGGSIEKYGFDGSLKVRNLPVKINNTIDKNSTIIKVSNELGYDTLIENDVEYKLTTETDSDGITRSFMEYIFRSYEDGSSYKIEGAELDPTFFKETLSKRCLFNNTLEPIVVKSFAIDRVRDRFLTVDNNFTLRSYKLHRDSFEKKLIKRTRLIDLGFEAENQRVYLGEVGKINLLLERAKRTILNVIIGRHTPERRLSYADDSDFNFEFLQADLTWGDSLNYFGGRNRADKYENFSSMHFENTYDEAGQYDFYVITLRELSFTEDYLDEVRAGNIPESDFKAKLVEFSNDPYQQKIAINSYSILCEEMLPEFEVDLDKVLVETALGNYGEEISAESIEELTEHLLIETEVSIDRNVSLWFENCENDLKLSVNILNKNYIFSIKRYYDYIFYDYNSGEGVVLEPYDNLSIIINETYTSHMSALKKVRNSTWIDEAGFKLGLSRELHESLNSYRHRVSKAMHGTLTQEKGSFYKSLGYITKLTDEDIFEISKVNSADNIKIDITSNRIKIFVDEVLNYEHRFDKLKFLIDLKAELDLLDFISVEVLVNNDSWHYKRCENLMPLSSRRQYLNLNVETQVKDLPKGGLGEIHDGSGDFINNVDESQIVSPYNYSLEDNILHKFKLAQESVTFEYQDFPLKLKWLPIKGCAVNDEDFDDLIKVAYSDNETYGDQTNVVENTPTEKLLSQNGSVIINKILKKQNTYWGA